MRGSIRQRAPGSWTLVFDLGYATDPNTGLRRRRQKKATFRGTKQQAQTRLTELLRATHRGEFVERLKLTTAEWLREWLEKAIKPPAKRPSTYRVYRDVLEKRVIPAIGAIPLQELKAADVKRYYTASTLSGSTLAQHHAIIHGALKAARTRGPCPAKRGFAGDRQAAIPPRSRRLAAELLGGRRGASIPCGGSTRRDHSRRHCSPWRSTLAPARTSCAASSGPISISTGAR